MRFFYYIAVAWIMCVINHPVLAKKYHEKAKQPVKSSIIYGTAALNYQLNQLINAHSPANITIYVKSMKFGDTLYTRNIYQPLSPASILKIFTAEAALLHLGADYRFTTQIFTDALKIRNGILQGNLYVVLNGDPSLSYNDLIELLTGLKKYQINAIAGNVYIDNTAYDQQFYGPGWVWKDKNSCYGAPISASIINRNCLPFQIAPAKFNGRPAQIITSPKHFYPSIRNTVLTTSAKTCSLRLNTNLNNIISIEGCMNKGRSGTGFSYVVTDVPEYNRALFKGLFSRLGISVYGSISFGTSTNKLSLINTHYSKPLHLLINEMLKKSDNVIAGALFKKLGQLYTRKPGSWENGSIAVSNILSKKIGLNARGMRILDGSGISPDNLATASQMMQVLDFAYHHYPTSYEFISSLPIAAVDGTLKHRMYSIAKKIRAKTGTISGVASLAGYAITADKEPLAFVIMINGNKGLGWKYRSLEDSVAVALTKYKRT